MICRKLRKSVEFRKTTRKSAVKAAYGDESWVPKRSSRQGIWSIREDLGVPSSPYFPTYARGQGPPPMVQERFQSVISQLFQYRIIRCGGPVDDDMANIIVSQLLYLDAVDPNKDIVMYINSPGGSVTAGMAIFDTMKHIRPDVSTVCVGLAARCVDLTRREGDGAWRAHDAISGNQIPVPAIAEPPLPHPELFILKFVKEILFPILMYNIDLFMSSMGAFLLSAGTKGKRFSLPNSRIMIHQPLGGFQGPQTDIEIQTNEMLHHKANLNGYLAYHTGQSYEKINQDTDRDYFMSAKEAKEYGLVDGVIMNPLKALQPLAAAEEGKDRAAVL
ncbi:hypothetical protein TSUD_36130 [Trifolium subterraneum]|uniref:ATP-dependent Clp protease proteolytic subunit n=1 Tax=Trifolium subterraneum TaxID=3900 RepID=A0A2Z6NML3_TRISU|nr:hypothetical protein TSUD_36130 [Trifolium subterraneum]